MKKLILSLALLGPTVNSAHAEESALNETAAAAVLATFGPTFATTYITYGDSDDRKMILAARDSAANYLIDGDVDVLLARAMEVLDRHGLKGASIEEKAVAVLNANEVIGDNR